jgi:hypothetical protein
MTPDDPQRNTPTLPAPSVDLPDPTDHPGRTPSVAVNFLLGELEGNDELIANLRRRLASAEGQLRATRNYRLQTIATPILAALVARGPDIDELDDEARSAARLAIIYAEALLKELTELEESDRVQKP